MTEVQQGLRKHETGELEGEIWGDFTQRGSTSGHIAMIAWASAKSDPAQSPRLNESKRYYRSVGSR
jgi:hypothetical protein